MCLKGPCQLLGFIFQLISRSCDNGMHVEGLLSANLCLFTLLSSEQSSQFERFRLQQVQMVNETSSVKTKLIGNNADETNGNCNTLRLTSNVLDRRLPLINNGLANSGQRSRNR